MNSLNYPGKRPQTVCIKMYYNVDDDVNVDDNVDEGGDVDDDGTRAILYGKLQQKSRTPIPRHSFCASLRQSRDTRFVRACGVEMHMDISQEPC